jgi:transcriptional regulator with XRE-family HTH domain
MKEEPKKTSIEVDKKIIQGRVYQLADNIRKTRLKRGESMKKTAWALDVALSTYQSWELGYRAPTLAKLWDLSDHFEIGFDELTGCQPQDSAIITNRDEIRVLTNYRCLNGRGREVLSDIIAGLLTTEKYVIDEKPEPLKRNRKLR